MIEQVRTLEKIVKNISKSVHDRVMAGYFLLLVCGRLRFSAGVGAREPSACWVLGVCSRENQDEFDLGEEGQASCNCSASAVLDSACVVANLG